MINRRELRHLIAVCFATGGCSLSGREDSMPADVRTQRSLRIDVDMLAPVSSLKGLEWPKETSSLTGTPGELATMAIIDRPHELAVRLPVGRALTAHSKITFLIQKYSKILDVKFVPHEDPMPFQDAIRELERLLARWEADPKPETRKRIADWRTYGNPKPDALPLPSTGGAIFRGESKVDLFFKIRPGDTGWFISTTIQATSDVSDHLRRLATEEEKRNEE